MVATLLRTSVLVNLVGATADGFIVHGFRMIVGHPRWFVVRITSGFSGHRGSLPSLLRENAIQVGLHVRHPAELHIERADIADGRFEGGEAVGLRGGHGGGAVATRKRQVRGAGCCSSQSEWEWEWWLSAPPVCRVSDRQPFAHALCCRSRGLQFASP